MDFQDKTKSDKGSIYSDKPEPIFENVVAQKYPQAFEQMQPEEVPAEITSAQEVDRPAPEVLQYMPSTAHEKKYRFFFIGAVTLFFLGILFVLFLVVRGGGGATAPVVPITLTYWGLWEDEKVLAPVFEKYKKANPHVTIVYEKRDPKGYLTWLQGRSPHGKGPDIFRYHNTWVPHLRNLDLLAPLPNEILSAADFEKTFHAIHQQDLKLDNRYYGLPLYVDGLVLLYNPDLLRSAGIASAPKLFAGDMLDAVSQVTVKGEGGPLTAGIALGTTNNVEHFSEIFGLIFLLNALESQGQLNNVWARNTFVGSTKDQNLMSRGSEAVQIYREFAESGYWGTNMPNSIDAFAQGKVAMIFAPTWQIPVIRAKNPDFVFRSAPLPEGLQGRKVALANYWVEGVSKYSPNQVEAWKLLTFMTESENLELLFQSQVQHRGMGMAYPRSDMKNKLTDHQELSPLMAQLDYMVSLPLVSRTFDEALNDEVIAYIGKAVDSAGQGVSYSAAFSQAAQGIAQTLAKYKIE
ncbi:MAG TPA: extracellular solute-binding protein [Candidatus Woesebacteria bacterium]|nr:extracellular solute-binding protein [Candidatus Woesebacteria bacterium]HNS94644.1 extracellular solute-binding protein [Candidatus Woesebacteria bacterium]